MDTNIIQALIAGATPFLRIDGAIPVQWCRNVQNGPRFGPWRFEAEFVELDGNTWQREGEVLYFVTDGAGRLRMVGESGGRLRDRWRMSPMHDVQTRAPLGRKALFHSTAWRAIECGLGNEVAPFTVSALFSDELARLLAAHGAMESLRKTDDHLCRRTEEAILAHLGGSAGLWNKKGVRVAPFTA